ncbi:hypothetical protein JMJ35_005119 [Cladonia borealis]|uniref:Uncharacterized protein n=1 Tax=Cladonia borealis TaxID=184061 RepID=A0AA39UA23_9LECA|nr:hypothetical protein JMJ35_005119 [Cladonia borealis]
MPTKSTFVSRYPLPLSVVSLGRLVTVPKAPGQDFFDPTKAIPTPPTPSSETTQINNVANVLRSGQGGGLEFALTSFAALFLKSESKDVTQLTALVGRKYLLLNSDDWLDQICTFQETRIWLERAAMRGRKIYLITSIEKLTNLKVDTDKSRNSGGGLGIRGPAFAATGMPLPTPLDLGTNMDFSIERGAVTNFEVPDEKVYNIEYRQVKVKDFKSSTPFDAKLSPKTKWEQIWSDRDASDMDDDGQMYHRCRPSRCVQRA